MAAVMAAACVVASSRMREEWQMGQVAGSVLFSLWSLVFCAVCVLFVLVSEGLI